MDIIDEKSPPGWGGTTLAMKKKHSEIDNPWALAWWMKKKDFKAHYKNDPDGTKSKKEPKKKDKYKDESFSFGEWLKLKEELTKDQEDNIKDLAKIKNPHKKPNKAARKFLDSIKQKMKC